MKKMRTWAGLLVLVAVLLAGCAEKGIPPKPEDGVLIYAALNPITNGLQARVDAFNDSHTDVQIEIRDYSDENGPQRLLVELTAGRIPDIMELQRLGTEAVADDKEAEVMWHTSPLDADLSGCYWMPYQRLVQKGYLEDLWPYIENDPDLGREGVLEAPLKAAEVDGGLYMLFREVSINTLVGAESVIGDRRGWTVEELMEAFSNMSADSTVLHYDTVRSKVFFALLGPTLSQYVNWNTGQCSFDSKEFRSMVEFLKCFPAEFDSSLSAEALEKEILFRRMDGLQMLESTEIGMLKDIPYYNGFFKDGVTYVGYPTVDGGSGGSTFLLHGNKLAMSSACQDKEAAWDFIRQLVQRSNYRSKATMDKAHRMEQVKIRINRKDYELGNKVDLEREETRRPLYSGGPLIKMFPPTEEEFHLFEDLINNTTQIYWPNDALSDIVWEALGPYFAGDKTMDETIALLQDRVRLYVNEQK